MDSSYRLLLIESEPPDASLHALFGELPEMRLVRVQRLPAALKRLAKRDIDAVVLEASSAGGSGARLLERVLVETYLPVVVLGTAEDEELERSSVRLGAQDYLPKGTLDAGLLRRSIRHAIDRGRSRDALGLDHAHRRALLDAMPDMMLRIQPDGTSVDLKLSTDASRDRKAAIVPESIDRRFPPEVSELYRRFLQRAILSGESQVFAYQQRVRDELRHFEAKLVPGGSEVVAIVRDTTESRRLENQLRLSQRLEAVGRLAGGIAHDFNNILTVISGNAELALMELAEEDSRRQELEEIREAARRAATLTRQLLAFSRKQILKPVPLDLNEMVRSTETMLRRLIGEDIELVTRLQSSPGTIRADPAQIEQILMNLAVNARDAMPLGGKLLFATEDVDVYETYAGHGVEVRSGPYVILAVSDTGQGMDAETRARIFEPFFTTKERAKGTGLGLSMVYGIVKQSGGYIWVYSEPGLGTTFKIYFPSDASPATLGRRAERARRARGHGETVLLVEDDVKVLEVAHRFLEEAGYRVISTSDITKALAIVHNHEGPIQLLATDVVMPGMSGRDLSERLRTIRPEMKTLYLSGYTEDAIAHHGVLEEGVAFLEKPYSQTDLLDSVRRVLDSGD